MDDSTPKTEDWNIRKFPLALKRKCQGLAKEEKKTDPRWLAEIVCVALGLPRDIYLDTVYKTEVVLGSTDENGQRAVRPSSPKDAAKTSAENIGNKSGKTTRGKT